MSNIKNIPIENYEAETCPECGGMLDWLGGEGDMDRYYASHVCTECGARITLTLTCELLRVTVEN